MEKTETFSKKLSIYAQNYTSSEKRSTIETLKTSQTESLRTWCYCAIQNCEEVQYFPKPTIVLNIDWAICAYNFL